MVNGESKEKPSRMTKPKSKRRKLIIILGLSFIMLATTWWYFRMRVPNVYGQFDPKNSGPWDPTTVLVFQGKKYKNISQRFAKKNVIYFYPGITLGQIEPGASDGGSTVVISSVFGHPDWLTVEDREEMGDVWFFQEEK